MIKNIVLSVKSKGIGLLLGLTLYALPFTLLPPTLFAAFEDSGTGARAAALAGGYVAEEGDVLSLLYNPAGLATVNRKEITSEYAKLFAGLTDGSNLSQTFLAYGQPVSWGGTVAASWKQFSLDSLYTERTLSLGYGEWITPKVAAGFALKQLYHSFTSPTIVVDDAGNAQTGTPSFFSRYGNSNTAYGADLGFLIKPIDRYTVGVSIQNFNEPNVALSPADHEVVSKTVRLGLAYAGPRHLKLMAGLTSHKELSTGPDVTWTGAAEKWWGTDDSGALAVRGSLSSGSREFQQAALGAAYRLSLFQLDYAFVFNIGGLGIGDTAGSHRFSLTYRFGKERDVLVSDARARKTKTAAEKARNAKKSQIERDMEIEGMLEDGLPRTTGVAAAAKPTGPVGPGLTNVKVQTTPSVSPSVQATDYSVPLTAGTATTVEKEIEPLTRLQVIARTLNMTTEYLIRANRHASADMRLAALDALFPMLQGYVRGSNVEMTDLMTQTDQLDAAKKDYGAMVWEGSSAADRLASLVKTLETWFASILRSRAWNAQDGRDIRYRAWLESALAEHEQLVKGGTTAQTRLDSIRRLASRALDFERQPSEPVMVPAVVAPTPIPTPVPVATPAPILISTAAPVGLPLAAPAAVSISTPTAIPAITPTVRKPAVAKAVTPARQVHATKKTAKSELEPVPALYKVKEGDTLISLAERFYGDYKRWREIYMLNKDRLGRGGNLKVGQLLIMPPKDKQN